MDGVLLQFIRHLRHHQVPVSPAETLDAMQVAAALGYQNRQRLRDGLQSCLAKSLEQQQQFSVCFDQFFGLSEHLPVTESRTDPSADNAPDQNSAEGEMPGANSALPGRGGGGGGQGDSLQTDLMQAAADVKLEDIRYPTQRGVYRRRLLEALPDAVSAMDIMALEQSQSAEDHVRARWLRARRVAQIDAAKALIDRQLLLNNQFANREIQDAIMREVSIAAMDPHYRKKLPELIRKLAKKLASRHRQHYRRSRRGRLDLGKTLKQNIAYDGVPFRRHWKSTRKQRSELLVLCDISGSVSAWSQLLLLFIHALSDVIPKTRSFVFCDRSVEVTDLFERMEAEQAMAEVFRRHGLGGSDYGRALQGFDRQNIQRINRHSTVIILGDGRCNGAPSGVESLRKIYQRARLVLWFNPEARSRWNTGDSEIQRFQSACHYVAECGNIRQLERLLDQLLTVLH